MKCYNKHKKNMYINIFKHRLQVFYRLWIYIFLSKKIKYIKQMEYNNLNMILIIGLKFNG